MDTPGGSGPAPLGPPEVVETHSSLIFLYGDQAHKVRKPIDLGFLDNRTVAARAEQSRREIALNSRMAPDVYSGVLEVRGPDGEVIDHVVRMRRLPAHRSLAALVRARSRARAAGAPGPDASGPGAPGPGASGPDAPGLESGVREVAGQLARLHAASPRTPEIDSAGSPEAVGGLWAESLEHLRRLGVGRDAPEIVDDIGTLASGFLRGRVPLLEARIADGRVVDGHGDLLAADVYLTDDGPRVMDCLEFDDRLRYGDAMADAGFLAMDLDASGARDLAALFLEAYRESSGDGAPASLVHHYIAYRALVRSKVTAIRAEQAADGGGVDARLALELADRAVDSLLRGRVRLVLVGGVSGSGKSTLAAPLARAMRAELLRSDLVRREVGDPGSPAPGDRYSEQAVDAVYRELLARAAPLLAQGRSVVLDATWLEPRRRAEAETVAADAHAELVEICCTAPRGELERRITERARRGTDPSEATVEVLEAQLAGAAAWPDAIEVDTTGVDVRDPDAVLAWATRNVGPLPWA